MACVEVLRLDAAGQLGVGEYCVTLDPAGQLLLDTCPATDLVWQYRHQQGWVVANLQDQVNNP